MEVDESINYMYFHLNSPHNTALKRRKIKSCNFMNGIGIPASDECKVFQWQPHVVFQTQSWRLNSAMVQYNMQYQITEVHETMHVTLLPM